MARYTDKDKLLENLKKQYGEELGWQCPVNMSDVGMMIEDAPTADVQEVRHGEWEEREYGLFYACSNCEYLVEYQLTNYCPNCGADMRGDRRDV